jgi:hypothetical protein
MTCLGVKESRDLGWHLSCYGKRLIPILCVPRADMQMIGCVEGGTKGGYYKRERGAAFKFCLIISDLR